MEIVRDWFRGPAVNNVCDSRRGAEINRGEIGTKSLLRAIGLQVWEGLRRLRSKEEKLSNSSEWLFNMCYLCVSVLMCMWCVCVHVCMHACGRQGNVRCLPNHSPSYFFLLSFLFVCFVLF